mmetsp:Transcript_108898/g.308037  ORF Transcript_108898/g.308037 Transcript_108898/m.308037 type:complete len:245 (-) Transcript_108898:125-859(-)
MRFDMRCVSWGRRLLPVLRLLCHQHILEVLAPARGFGEPPHPLVAGREEGHVPVVVVRAEAEAVASAIPQAHLHVVDEQAGAERVDLIDDRGEGVHGERCAHDDQELSLRQVGLSKHAEPLGKAFAEENDVRLHKPVVTLAAIDRDTPREDFLLDPVARVRRLATQAVRLVEAPVGLHEAARLHASPPLQGVDVLRETTPQDTLVLQQPQERVRGSGREVPRVQLARKLEERQGVFTKVFQVED